ncbi:MAG TPA: SurA N-terminal domain-containing protein [Nannocystaceae bacterium]|nr:SurA N-terminal domain-containing protein [Nannocystaceae bacterium]
MLEFLRKSATSLFAWLILILLAVVFGFSFGLPSDSLTFGKTKFASVHGESIGEEEYRYEFNAIRRIVRIPQDARYQELMGLKEEVLEGAIERDLLAEIAEGLGLAATVHDAEDLTLAGQSIVLGQTYEWLGGLEFNYDLFTKSFLPALQVSEKQYLELQRREILARTLRDVIASGVAISEGELRAIYDENANRISLRYARYSPAFFGELVDPSKSQIEGYLEKNRDALKAELAKQESRFSKLPKQARVWVISVDKGDASGDAKGKIDAARARLAKGEDFRAVAREVSTHETARRGGDFGWVSETAGTGIDPAIDAALPGLADGELPDVIEGETAIWLVRVTGRREGDVAEDDALLELAEEGFKREQGRSLAAAAAEEDLAQLAGGAALTDVFSGGAALPGGEDIENAGAKKDAAKVELRDTGSFSKGEPIPGLGSVPAIVEAVWAAEADQGMLPQTFEVGDDLVLVGVESKEEATDAGFAEMRPQIYRQVVRAKANMVNSRWANRQCLEAKGRGDISVSDDKVAKLVTYENSATKDAEGKPQMKPYAVCDRVGMRGGLLRPGIDLGGGE